MLLLRFVFVQNVCLCLEIFLQPVDFYLTTLSAGDNIIKLVIEHILLLLLSGQGSRKSRGGGDFVRAYEVMYIIKPVEDEVIDGVIAKFEKLLTDNGATVEKTDRWGKKHLAYLIQDLSEGYYVLVNFKAEPAAVKELDRVMKITDEVLRHMIIKKED